MNRAPNWLLSHQKNVHSQTGEDGVVEKILELLPARDGWCVEFGAWDGLYYTNTRHLIESKGYSAVLIEASPRRFRELKRNYAAHQNVYPMCQFVGFRTDDNLDTILRRTPIPRDFDFLSIDIDGNDYHVWKAFTEYKPKIIVIEFNPTFPVSVEFVQPPDPSVQQGASLRALVNLGREKGYELACVMPFNAFFVRRDLFPRLEMPDNALEKMWTDASAVTYLCVGYDGSIILHGNRQIPWHLTPIRTERLQYLPRYLRRNPGSYSLFDKILFGLWLAREDPRRMLAELRRRLSA
jgi:hypothetical protein